MYLGQAVAIHMFHERSDKISEGLIGTCSVRAYILRRIARAWRVATAAVEKASIGRIAGNIGRNRIQSEDKLVVSRWVPDFILLIQCSPFVDLAEIVLASAFVHIGPTRLSGVHPDRANWKSWPGIRWRAMKNPHVDVHAKVLR